MKAWISRLAAGCLAGASCGRAQTTNELPVLDRVQQASALIAAQDEGSGRIVYSGGFFVASNGMFLTAFQAVRDCTRAQILLWDGTRVGVDAVANYSPLHNLALLKISGATNAVSLPLADPSQIAPNLPIHALGVTTNRIPCNGVMVRYQAQEGTARILYDLPGYSLSPLHSGTPVWDDEGRVRAVHLGTTYSAAPPPKDDLFQRAQSRFLGEGVPADEIAAFLNLPPRHPVALRDLQHLLRQAAAARALLAALVQTDAVFREVQRPVAAARIREASAPGERRRLHVALYSFPTNVFPRIRAAMEEQLRRGGTPDPRLRRAFENWTGAMDRLTVAVEEIRAQRFGGAANVDLQIGWIENEFLQINDQVYAAVEDAWQAYQAHAPFDEDPRPFNPQPIQDLYRFYLGRGLSVDLP